VRRRKNLTGVWGERKKIAVEVHCLKSLFKHGEKRGTTLYRTKGKEEEVLLNVLLVKGKGRGVREKARHLTKKKDWASREINGKV